MRIIDISRPIYSGAPVYPGDPPIEMSPASGVGPGSAYRVTRLGGWTTHVMTHLDAPSHFIADGVSLDAVPLEQFVVEALVALVDGDAVTLHHVPADALEGRAVLFRTRASASPAGAFTEDHPYLTPGAAQTLVQRRASLVGIDAISVDRHGGGGFLAHRTLLDAGVIILEGLDLSRAGPGRYTLVALPLRIENADGSPVRAVLFSPSLPQADRRFPAGG